MFLCQFVVGVQWIHHLVTSLVVYAMFMLFSRRTCAVVVPTFVMVYCVLGHLHRQYTCYLGWDLDFTSAYMTLAIKLYMMAYNLYDGEVLAQGHGSRAARKCAPFAIRELPGLIEYLGYTFCFSNILFGPAYEFTTYRNAVNGSLLYTPDGKPKGTIPSNCWPTLRPLLLAVFNVLVMIVLGSRFPILDPANPSGTPILLQPAFLAKPWVERFLYLWLALVLDVRQKYYFIWHVAEGANNVWYSGFEGFTDKGEALGWENSSNVNMWEFETAPSMSAMLKVWNKKSALWLNKYVYIRTNGNLLAVFSMSAFWHGFYPGYYMFFMSLPLVVECERLARKTISPYFSSKKWSAYGVASILSTIFIREYVVSPFVLLAFERSWNYWKSHFFYGHFVCIFVYMALSMVPRKKQKTV
jgi:MBOAT, membrane-bound O-acyltransferase family